MNDLPPMTCVPVGLKHSSKGFPLALVFAPPEPPGIIME
jgi:hypothetical protein